MLSGSKYGDQAAVEKDVFRAYIYLYIDWFISLTKALNGIGQVGETIRSYCIIIGFAGDFHALQCDNIAFFLPDRSVSMYITINVSHDLFWSEDPTYKGRHSRYTF